MYLFHYYIEYIKKCFNDTYNKENEINLQKKKPTTITGNRYFFTY